GRNLGIQVESSRRCQFRLCRWLSPLHHPEHRPPDLSAPRLPRRRTSCEFAVATVFRLPMDQPMIRTGCLFLVLALAGCGGPRTKPVEGTVLLDGKPLSGASIQFVPQ